MLPKQVLGQKISLFCRIQFQHHGITGILMMLFNIMIRLEIPCALILFATLIVACSPKSDLLVTSQNGIWHQEGYGRVMNLQDSIAFFYDINSNNCNPSFSEPIEEIGEILDVTDDALTLLHGINRYRFERLEKLPFSCDSLQQLDNKDPVKNFEALWSTFNEHYAYFDIRDINWQKAYSEYKSKITANTTDLELFHILEEMVESIGDGHVGIGFPEHLETVQENESQSLAKTVEDKPKRSVHSMRQEYKELVCNHYLKEVKKYNSGVVRWGMMRDNIAYVQINWMILLGDYRLPAELSIREFWDEYWEIAALRDKQRNDEIYGARMIMDSIVRELSTADAFIVDIRFNGGGKDDAALEFIGHFADKDITVFSKKAKLENGFTTPQKITLKSSEVTFDGPVYLLTSPQTASAAEIMTLSSMALPQVIRIGGDTEGIFSDMLDKVLPNGWDYSLSNELYEDKEGNNYENIGIPPHHSMNYSRDSREMFSSLLADFNDGDHAIDLAIKLANSN